MSTHAAARFDPFATLIHLREDGRALPVEWTPEVFRTARRGRSGSRGRGEARRRAGRLPRRRVGDAPAGDELLYLLTGAIDAVLDEPGGERLVALRGGQACLVPQGVWHRLILRPAERPPVHHSRPGTRHRPVSAGDRWMTAMGELPPPGPPRRRDHARGGAARPGGARRALRRAVRRRRHRARGQDAGRGVRRRRDGGGHRVRLGRARGRHRRVGRAGARARPGLRHLSGQPGRLRDGAEHHGLGADGRPRLRVVPGGRPDPAPRRAPRASRPSTCPAPPRSRGCRGSASSTARC